VVAYVSIVIHGKSNEVISDYTGIDLETVAGNEAEDLFNHI
jgi:hypothetical protein